MATLKQHTRNEIFGAEDDSRTLKIVPLISSDNRKKVIKGNDMSTAGDLGTETRKGWFAGN